MRAFVVDSFFAVNGTIEVDVSRVRGENCWIVDLSREQDRSRLVGFDTLDEAREETTRLGFEGLLL